MPAERGEIGRLDTLSDGVFAIAATLLILNVSSQVFHAVSACSRLP